MSLSGVREAKAAGDRLPVQPVWDSHAETPEFAGASTSSLMIRFISIPASRHRGHRGFDSHAVGLGFERVFLDHRYAAAEWIPDAPRSLLDHMPKLVTEQLLSLNRVWIVLARSEVNVCAPGVGDRAYRGRIVPDVNSDVREISAKGGFHFGAHIGRKRQAACFRSQRHLKCFHARTGLALNCLWS